jgi:hypothetical protein
MFWIENPRLGACSCAPMALENCIDNADPFARAGCGPGVPAPDPWVLAQGASVNAGNEASSLKVNMGTRAPLSCGE